jgi:hypothetical protein
MKRNHAIAMEGSVRTGIEQFIAASLVMFVAAGAARADNGCKNSTLDGLYALHASGFNIVGGAAQPKTILEMIEFNGDGTLTTPKVTLSINGAVSRGAPGESGTYAINPDCTGRLAFGTTGPTFDLAVGTKSSQVFMIQTGPGNPVFSGTADQVLH